MDDSAAAARAQWRAEEELWSRAALERWEHGRGLDDVFRDCLHRGDVVSCAFAVVTWTGRVSAVGVDVARVDVDVVSAPVHLRLGIDAPYVVRTRSAAATQVEEHVRLTTFHALLRELDGSTVSVGTPIGSLEGRLRVGRDHLRLTDRDGSAAYVPAASAWWVRPLDDD